MSDVDGSNGDSESEPESIAPDFDGDVPPRSGSKKQDGHADRDQIAFELREVTKRKPELQRYILMSGKERHCQNPDMFSTKSRLLQKFRPKVVTEPKSAQLTFVANSKVLNSAAHLVDRESLMRRWKAQSLFTNDEYMETYYQLSNTNHLKRPM